MAPPFSGLSPLSGKIFGTFPLTDSSFGRSYPPLIGGEGGSNYGLAPFLQVKVSVVNSAGGSFCWNHATDTFYGNYAGDNICCIYAGFEVILFVTGMMVDLSISIKQVTVSVAIMQIEVSGAHLQVTVFKKNFMAPFYGWGSTASRLEPL